MKQPTLEQRVATLEKQFAELTVDHANGTIDKPWLRTMGGLAGDEGMKAIFDEALKLREMDRRKARRRYAKKTTSRRVRQ